MHASIAVAQLRLPLTIRLSSPCRLLSGLTLLSFSPDGHSVPTTSSCPEMTRSEPRGSEEPAAGDQRVPSSHTMT